MDVAIVVGHHPNAQGATLSLGQESVTEWELWKDFAYELALTCRQRGLDVQVVRRPNEKPDKALGRRVNDTGADVGIELHFNAAAAEEARGTKMIHWPGSEEGKRLAATLQQTTLNEMGLKSRGTEARDDLGFLRYTDMPSVICEPAFGSNQSDGFKLLSRLPELMKAYRVGLRKHLNA